MKAKTDKIILNEIWLKATILGSLWAGFEIIVGSFIHNLRMPFAGTLLSSFAVILLVAFYQVWKEKGIILRAGLICALMKSVSPSAVIFGPMIGIITEALILEVFVILAGRNLFSYMLGGSLAVFSALIHKAVNLILLYSFDLVTVYLNMINYAENKLNLPESSAQSLLIILSGIYLFVGGISAILGYFIGKKALMIKSEPRQERIEIREKNRNPMIRKYPFPVIIIHLLLLISALWYFSGTTTIYLKFVLTFIYGIIMFGIYRNIFRRLMKPLFWIQLVVILLLASLFLNYRENNDFSFSLAITAGLSMLFRAFVVILSFSAIGRELSDQRIRNYLVNRGFHNLYLALQLAFEILPHLSSQNSELKNFFKNPFSFMAASIAEANNWLYNLKENFGDNTD